MSKPRKWILIAGGGLAGLVVIAALALAYVLKTEAGRRTLANVAEDAIGGALGGPARIGAAEGDWPGLIVLRDVSLADADGVWAEIDAVRLRWRPLSALFGGLYVQEAAVTGARLARTPNLPEQDETPPEAGPGAVSPPQALPRLRIEKISVKGLALAEPVLGRAAVLDAAGQVRSTREALDAQIRITSRDGADRIEARAGYAAAGDGGLSLDAQVNGAAGGLIAALIGAPEDASSLRLTASGPADAWTGELEAGLGDFGDLRADLSGGFSEVIRLALDGAARAGPALPETVLEAIGPSATFAIALEAAEGRAEATVESLEAAAAALTARIALEDKRSQLLGSRGQDISGEGTVTLKEGPAGAAAIYLGEALAWSFAARLGPDGGAALDRFSLTGDYVDARVTDAEVSADGAVSGAVTAALTAPALGAPAELSAAVAGRTDGVVRIEGASLTYGEDLAAAEADGAFDTLAETLTASANVRIRAEAAERAALGLTLSGPLSADVTANGPLSALSVSAEAKTPALRYDAFALDAAAWRAAATLSAEAPKADIDATFSAGGKQTGVLKASVTPGEDGALALELPTFRYRSLQGSGDARTTPGGGVETAQLSFTAKDLTDLLHRDAKAEPLVAGDLKATLGLLPSAGGSVVTAEVTSSALAAGGLSIDDAAIAAEGALGGLDVSVKADRVTAPGVGEIGSPRLTATLTETAQGQAIEIAELAAVLFEQTASLIEPARVTLTDEAVRLEAAALSYGEAGRIDLGGGRIGDAIEARLSWRDIAAPGLPVTSAGEAEIDTAQAAAPGRVKLALASTAEDLPASDLTLTGGWTGEALTLAGDIAVAGAAPRQFLSGAVPLALDPATGALSTEGALDIKIDYDGPLSDFAGFAPEGVGLETGDLKLTGAVDGAMDAPDWRVALNLAGGRVTQEEIGLTLAALDVAAKAAPDGDGVSARLEATATDGRETSTGRLAASGAFTASAEGQAFDGSLSLEKMRLANAPVAEAIVSGAVNLKGALDDLALTGRVDIDELDAQIPDTPTGPADIEAVRVEIVDEDWTPVDADAEKRRQEQGRIALDLTVASNGRVFVRGRGLESEWTSTVRIKGTARQPRIGGALQVKRGALELAGRRFDIARGVINFQSTEEINPLLDIIAETEARNDVIARLIIGGTAMSPTIALSSDPPLPDADVMALILFGRPANELTPIEALQAAEAAAQLTAAGPLGGAGAFNRARRSLGLDALNVGFDESGEVDVAVGKYLNDDIFIEASQDTAGAAGEVSVEIDLTDTLSVKTVADQNNDQNIQLIWQRDY